MEEVEVKTIWSGMVKPMHPTPSQLKTFKLSLLDQIFPLFHTSTLLFYSAPTSSSLDLDHLIIMMKTNISKALSQFYPLAGRLLDDSTVLCNDQGVLFTHTQVTCPLKSYLSLISKSMFYSDDNEKLPVVKLLPSRESLHGSCQYQPIPISAWLQLSFQVNVFQCGGIAIGCYKNHKLLDATSLITFLQHLVSLCTGMGHKNLIQPNFNAALTAFPPCDPEHLTVATKKSKDGVKEQLQKSLPTTSNITCKTFVFKPTAMIALREMSASNQIPHPTRVESVLGFLWKHCLQAEAEAEAEAEVEGPMGRVRSTALTLTVNMRSRARPPFPRESIGNFSIDVIARLEKRGFELVDLVAEIRGAISDFNDQKLVREIQGDKGAEALSQHSHMIVMEGLKRSTYRVSCQCRLGVTGVDFGFGKPIWVCPLNGVLHPMLRNFIFLMDHIDPTHAIDQDQVDVNGIQAWVLLDKKQMQILETSPDFLAFASPLDLSSMK